MHAIEVHGLTKTFRNGTKALSGLDLNIRRGEIFSLLGENGAGKSTLIQILTTYRKPTSGRVTVLGMDLFSHGKGIRSSIACVSQQTTVDEFLTVQENMAFQGRLHRCAPRSWRKRIDFLLDTFELSDYKREKTEILSGGMKRRLDIAMRLVSCPEILFLDEPTLGLDIASRKTLWDTIHELQNEEKVTVLLTTHYLEEAENLSNTVGILRKGRCLVQDSLTNLLSLLRNPVVKLVLPETGMLIPWKEELLQLPFILSFRHVDSVLWIGVEDADRDFPALNQFLLDQRIPFFQIGMEQPTLEDVYLLYQQKEA